MAAAEHLQLDAEAAWDGALADIDDQAEWVDQARQSARQLGLHHNGELVVRSVRPRLLTRESCEHDRAVVSAAITALDAAADYVLADPALRRRCLGDWADDPRMLDLLEQPSGYPQKVVLGRFDGSRTDAGVNIIEFNGGLPGGVMPTQASAAWMRAWPAFAELESRVQVDVPDLARATMMAVLSAWRGFGGTGPPFVAFAVPTEMRGQIAISLDFMVRLAQASGMEVSVCDPGDLRRSGGRLTLDGRAVDVVQRVFFTSMVDQLGSRLDDLLAAVRAGEVCMVTSFRSGLLGHKSLFAIVTDPSIDLGLTPQQQALIDDHMPWTRVLGDTSTTGPDGAAGSLPDILDRHRDRLVLKPADGTGGADVHLGWDMNSDQWQAAVAAAQSGGTWIVQDRVPMTSVEVPVLEVGFPRRRFIDDHNPIVLDDTVAGYYVRLSESSGVTNLTTGAGTVVPTFFIAPRG